MRREHAQVVNAVGYLHLAGHRFPGPAVITQEDCTTVIPPGFTATVDAWTNLRIVPVGAA